MTDPKKSKRAVAGLICIVAIVLTAILGYQALEELRSEEVQIFSRSGHLQRVAKKATDPNGYRAGVMFSAVVICFLMFTAISQVRSIVGPDEKKA